LNAPAEQQTRQLEPMARVGGCGSGLMSLPRSPTRRILSGESSAYCFSSSAPGSRLKDDSEGRPEKYSTIHVVA
jgi:hypothetical protein